MIPSRTRCEHCTRTSQRYRRHGAALEKIWPTLDKPQRTKCIKAGALDGVVLKHRADRSLGNVCKIIPEWNLRDVTDPCSNFLLDLLKHRATKTLSEQYFEGVNGEPGDHAFILDQMQRTGLESSEDRDDEFFIFIDDQYGRSFKLLKDAEGTLAEFAPYFKHGICVKYGTGALILHRQITLMQSLSIIIEDILEEGSRTRDRKERAQKSHNAATTALSKLSIQQAPQKPSLSDVVGGASEQGESLREYLRLLSSEPVVLAHATNITFFSRPELVLDERGRQLAAISDRYISASFLEAVHVAIKGAATWTFIVRLVKLLEDTSLHKLRRAVILQELSNVCHLEYSRAQALFRRHVQGPLGIGSKWFKRVSGVYDKTGNARVNMKGDPESLTRADPQLHYILRLCQPETTAPKAVDWLKKLGDLHDAHNTEREKLSELEIDSLSDLAVITVLTQDLSAALSMPSFSRKKGQAFTSRSQQIETELSQLKTQIDLGDYVAPIDTLLENGMASKALQSLDQFIIDKTGTSMGFLYEDAMQDCLQDVRAWGDQEVAKAEKKSTGEWIPLPVPAPQPVEKLMEFRREKEKTRPAHSSFFEIGSQAEHEETNVGATLPKETLKVSPSAAVVFSRLFAKSEARGSVNWVAFQAAMAELGFSVMPKFGSVFTFIPPDAMATKKSLTLHRPHQSRIEGYLIPIFAQRLTRVYGWDEGTFVFA